MRESHFDTITSKASAIENVAVLTVAGAGVGLIGAIGKGIYNAIKNKKSRFETQELQKQITKIPKIITKISFNSLNFLS